MERPKGRSSWRGRGCYNLRDRPQHHILAYSTYDNSAHQSSTTRPENGITISLCLVRIIAYDIANHFTLTGFTLSTADIWPNSKGGATEVNVLIAKMTSASIFNLNLASKELHWLHPSFFESD